MTIREWFENNGTYEAGYDLLKSVPGVATGVLLHLKHFTPSKLFELKYELKKAENSPLYKKSLLKKKLVLKPKKKEVVNTEGVDLKTAVNNEFNKESIAMYPVELHDIYRNRISTFYEMCSLKIQLNKKAPDEVEESLSIIMEIEKKQLELNKYWSALNYWRENGRLLPVVSKTDFRSLSAIELFKRKANIETSISKREKTLYQLEEQLQKAPFNAIKHNTFLRKKEVLEQLKIDLDTVKDILND